MHRLLLIMAALCLSCSTVSYADEAKADNTQAATIKAGLQAIEDSLPPIKANLDKLKSRGQDISYPMVSYTVLQNFVGYSREETDYGDIKRAVDQLSELEWIQRKLKSDISLALAGKLKFPIVPRWTGDTRPVIKGSSFIAPTKVPGKSTRQMRPVFFNGYGHFSQVQDDIEKWPNYGINMIQFETGPMIVFPEEGKVKDVTPDLLKTLDRAKKAGVAVNLLLSPHYFPEWMFNKYPELRKQREYFLPMCLHAPECKEFLRRYVKLVVEPIKDHPALHSICVSNEPRNVEEPCKYANEEFRAWLKARHGDIATLNGLWRTSYADFDEITVPNPFNEQEAQQPMCRWVEFVRWNEEFFTAWHKMLADAVHEVAPNVPVHAKVQSFTLGASSEVKCGNDAYLYGKIFEINGNDSSNNYDFGNKDDYTDAWLSNNMYYDLQRSAKDAPVFNSENHIVEEGNATAVPAEHIRTALWQQAIHGQSATTIWLWQRAINPKTELYGNFMQRPSCARAVGITNLDLNRAAYEVTALQQTPEQVIILQSTSTATYEKGLSDSSLFRTYIALNFMGMRIGFITERQLEDGIVPKAGVLVIPNTRHLSNAAFETLKKYKGHVMMIGNSSLAYDEYDKKRSETIKGEIVPFIREQTKTKDIYRVLKTHFAVWKVGPKTTVVDEKGDSIWGVEWREAETATGRVVNLCSYLTTPVTIKLRANGKDVKAVDVLTGKAVSGVIKLKPLDVRLLKIKK
ncbi:beta-galactosidase [bacterium]|nr:beta-galactosidase [bacterium]